ncbi:MAG: ABC transporter substrate-binding protein, partial [Dehalococcoidia bacterium]|nr:ABC transporter substrate-binding protein [Dehalococcoidia bacterium]
MKSLALILLAIVVTIASITACNPVTPPGPGVITDDHGRTVDIAETPERIVSLAPSITEILFALDLGDKVVGVTDYCDYPEELVEKIDAGEIQRVGAPWPGFSLETIVSLDPDLAFAIGDTVPDYVNDLEGLEIPTIILQPEIIDDIFHDIELVGIIVGKQGDAAALVADLEDDIDEIVAKVANAPVRSVFYGVDVSDQAMLWTVGNGTFIDDLITLAGGDNIAGNLEGWPTYNLEDLVNSNPDVIVL